MNITYNKMKKKKYLISIIIPFISRKQNNIDLIKKINFFSSKEIFEFILVNDGRDKISKEQLNLNKNIKYFNLNSFSGPGRARNMGVRKASGDWIIFLDSDDILNFKNLLKKNNIIIKKTNNIIAFNYKSNEKNYLHNKQKFFLTYSNYKLKNKLTNFFYLKLHYPIIFFLFKKKFLLRNKIKFKKGYYEDILFLLKVLLKNNNKKIYFIKEIIYIKNFTKKSITSQFSIKHMEDYIKVWILCSKLLKYNLKDKILVKKLIQVAFRGVLGYLIFNLKKKILPISKIILFLENF